MAAEQPVESSRSGGGGGGGQEQQQQTTYPVKRFVYVIANITALSGLLFGCVWKWEYTERFLYALYEYAGLYMDVHTCVGASTLRASPPHIY